MCEQLEVEMYFCKEAFHISTQKDIYPLQWNIWNFAFPVKPNMGWGYWMKNSGKFQRAFHGASHTYLQTTVPFVKFYYKIF